tara:strand:- start:819 stop:1565 length:747 start_codon:yes stop_codon:yes gene_type:complete
MAINVDTVYKTVLLLLNKEQRGYMTPTEFNSVATQVQLEIFEQYFSDLNQQLRVQQTDFDYADRVTDVDEKISVFKTFAAATFVAASGAVPAHFTLPSIDAYGNNSPLYRLDAVVYTPTIGYPTSTQRLNRTEFYNLQKSDLTASSLYSPTYLYEDQKIFISPSIIQSGLEVNYVRKPGNIVWGFTVGNVLGQYIYSPNSSLDFELMPSEQTTVILKILFYAGLIIEDPAVVQIASQQVQSKEINQKS